MPPSNVAIHYVPAGYETKGPKLMGRMAAGEAFLDAYLRHAGVERFYCYAQERKAAEQFAAEAQGRGRRRSNGSRGPIPPASPGPARSTFRTPACTTMPGAGVGAISAPTA